MTCPKCRNKFDHGSPEIDSQAPKQSEPVDSASRDDPASESPTSALNDPKVPGVSSPTEDAVVAVVLFGIAAAFFLIFILGWAFFLTLVLWIVVVTCGAGAILFTLAALDSSSQDSERASFWWVAAICAFIGFVAWNWIPSIVSSTNAAQPVAGRWAN